MIEISQQKDMMEHARKAYEHIGKMMECLEDCCNEKMDMRDDDEWYVRRYNGDREDGQSRYRRPHRMMRRDPYYD